MEFILTIITALLAISTAQDLVFPAAPEEQEDPGKLPSRLSEARVPLYIPGRCPPNQLLYPGDQEHDYVCDCGPGFIYYPPKDGCFKAYRKGPCEANQYLILPKDKVIPVCINNPCRPDGFVQYQGKCYELEKAGGPCKPASEGGGVFSVNATTLALECLQIDGGISLNLISFPRNCPPGGRRSANCRQPYRRKWTQ